MALQTSVASGMHAYDPEIADMQTAMNSILGVLLFTGTGSPNAVVTASPGSLYLNLSGGAGTTLYVKESGVGTNTGWVAK
jgi:hypothetical protein